MKTRLLSAGVGFVAAAWFGFSPAISATTVTVYVGMNSGASSNSVTNKNGYTYPGDVFSPATLSINVGDSVQWVWDAGPHSTTSGTPGKSSGIWDSGIKGIGSTFTYQFNTAGTFPYYCTVHGACCGMTGSVTVTAGTPTPTPTPTPNPTVPAQALNISTRIQVKTGDQVLIGGFIITGTTPKRLILRAIGPSLAKAGIADPLADPVLELHASDQTLITSNDNWQDTDEADIMATGLAPSNLLESAIVETLDPGTYTAVVSGKNGGTGVGLVEVYDLDQSDASQLANISTRGSVQTANNVMIGGFILGGGGADTTVLIRALGPSLTQFGITGALSDPFLELHDSNGNVIGSNNNWKDSQQTEIEATGLQPSDDTESALLETLGPSAYTAIVTGQNGVTGVALVEVYRLQ